MSTDLSTALIYAMRQSVIGISRLSRSPPHPTPPHPISTTAARSSSVMVLEELVRWMDVDVDGWMWMDGCG